MGAPGTDFSRDWLYRKIVEDTQTAIVFADREGVVKFWNTGAESLFGYGKDEALGKSLDLIVPEKHRKAHWAGYHRVMETGHTAFAKETLKVPALRKDGSRISLEFTITIVRDEDGRTLGVAAVFNDVTERWQKEKALRERVTELEAKLKSSTPG